MQQININNIPEEMKALNNWVLWKIEADSKGKPTKKPKQINGKNAISTNKKTWTSFNKAFENYANSDGYYDGIGFMFSDSDYAGIDLDKCIDAGIINQFAQDIIKKANSYTELSQSGTGIHIIVKGSIPDGVKRKEIEFYSDNRFFTMTGNRINENNIMGAQDLLNELYLFYKGSKKTKESVIKNSEDKKELDIDELLGKAFTSKNCFKIGDLYNGNWQHLYSSQSEADQALCNYLAFWLDKDFDSVDTAFRSSMLYREKWEREDYRTATISKAISSCEKSYQDLLNGDLETEIFKYDFSDLGIAQRFKDMYKDILKYVVDGEFYCKWSGKQWIKYSKDLPVKTLAIEFASNLAKKINRYIECLTDQDRIKAYEKIANKVKSEKIINVVS